MAVYDMEPFSGRTLGELIDYVNRLNERLRHVLENLDEENMTDEYAKKTGG